MSRRLSAATAVVVAVTLAAPLTAGRATSAGTADARIATMDPAAQANLLEPLRQLADALDAQGRAKWASTYAGVDIDAAADAVDLYATDQAAEGHLLAAARRAVPDLRWNRVRMHRARYSRVRLDAAAKALLSDPRAGTVRAVAVRTDSSGLDVQAVSGRLPSGVALDADGISLATRTAEVTSTKSWAQAKWHDVSPFIGGDQLTRAGHSYCTAGLPAVRRSDHKPVMITAAHCFATGTRIYTAAGKAGAYGNCLVGSYVGTVKAKNTHWDAEEVIGANNNADESDTSGWKPLTSTAYSYVGDYVCQNGAASFYLHHPTPCGIKVTDADIYFRIGGHIARGVEGIDVAHGWGSHNGDSGATVFSVRPGNKRQARGIISSGGLDGTSDQKRVDWTEAVDIFAAFGLKLNPKT